MAETGANVPLVLPVIAPTEDEWRAMTPDARQDLLVRILDALSDPAAARSEAELEARADEAQVEEAQARLKAAQARAREAQAQAREAFTALREGIAALLDARGITCSSEAQARLSSCSDAATLQRWLLKAMTAGTEEEVFSS